jgi:osmotically inducible protein OsmC
VIILDEETHVDRTAKAQWRGDLKSGSGIISSASGVLSNTPYSFKTRFEQGNGTNPEELLAAAHAGCFSMALSLMLQNEGLRADSIDTTCTVTLDKEGDGFAIKRSHLDLTAKIPGASQDAFNRAAQAAKEGCPVSKLFDTEITLDAKLES